MSMHEKEPCSICGEMIGIRQMKPHMQRKHEINPLGKNFKCQYCVRGFALKHIMQNHENTHTGARPHMCKLCGTGFAGKGTLSRHERSCSKAKALSMEK